MANSEGKGIEVLLIVRAGEQEFCMYARQDHIGSIRKTLAHGCSVEGPITKKDLKKIGIRSGQPVVIKKRK